MYRIRFHGRGGQGMKTSSRILGTSFFLQGYEVQDAPKYGAERRGAPMSAYVRAAKNIIYERGVIHNPDLVIVADETLLVTIPEILLEGLGNSSHILINTRGNISEWKEKHGIKCGITYLPVESDESEERDYSHITGTACAASAAALTGVIGWNNVENAIRDEHSSLSHADLEENIEAGFFAYNIVASSNVHINEHGDDLTAESHNPGWIKIEFNRSGISSPAIHNPGTSRLNNTGSWRTIHPEIMESICSRCRLCGIYCPDNAISIKADGYPSIDYTHCKGCLICSVVCPRHAISYTNEKSIFRRKHYRGEQ